MGIHKHLQYIAQLFDKVNSFELSREAREPHPDLNLTYGEINLESFLALVSISSTKDIAYFYDLGCGVGKTLFSIAYVYPDLKCLGIEKLFPLIHVAKQLLLKEPSTIQERIQFIHDDLLNVTWHQNSIVFINIASFIQDTWQQLNDKCLNTPAKVFITCCKPLKLPNYHVYETQVQCSWGIRPAYIHQVIVDVPP